MSINVGTAVAYLDLDASKFTAGLKAAQQSLQDVSKDTNTFSTKITSLGSGLKQAGATLSLVSIPLLGLGTVAVKTAADFQSAMSKVEALSGSTKEEMQMLEEVAKKMGTTTVYSSKEAAEALQYMSLAGWNAEQMAAGLEPTLKLAGAAGMELSIASDIVTDTLSMFGMKAEEATKLTDALAYAQANSNTSVEQLGEALKYCGASANAMGYDIADTSAMLGVLADSGLKGSVAGTTLNAVFRDMKKAMQDGCIQIGNTKVAIDDGNGSYRDMEAILQDVVSATSGMSAVERDAALSTIFGTEALKGMNIMLQTGTDRLSDFENGIRNSDGAANDMYNTMQNNLNGAIANLKGAFEGLLITIGDALIPIIQAVAEKLTAWCTWFNNLNSTTQTVIIAIGGFIAILGPLLLIIGQLIISVTAIVGVFTSGGVAATAFGVVMGALSGPIGIVIGVITALITIGVLLYKNWEEICAFGTQVWNAFTQWFSATMESVTNFFKQVWESCCQAVSNIWESIKTTAANVFNGIKDTITNITNGTKAVIQSIWEVIKNYFSSVLNNIKNIVSTLFNNVRNIINSIMQGISNQIQNIWNAIKTIFSNVLGLIKGIVSTDFALIKSSITNILNAVKDFCSSTWSNILSTCSSILGGIVNTVANIFNGIKNSIANGLQAAYNTALGWWENIKSIFSAPINAVVNIFKKESAQNLDDGIAVASDVMPTNENLSRARFDFESTRNALDTSYITQSLMQSGLNALETKLNVKQSNQPVNNNNTINLNLNIDKVENSNERNIEDLADELAFYLKRKRVAF